MGAGANSSQNKALNDKKERAAGRQDERGPAKEAIADAQGKTHARGDAGGASGSNIGAGDAGGAGLEGGGGGGASPDSRIVDVGAAKRKAH